ncbi:MAG: P1 family peptidase [Kiloniellaceae bacterium]
MPRIRELGIYRGDLPTGGHNAITDVEGVAVGHCTVVEGEGAWTGQGPFRTGVTIILPHRGNLYEDKVSAAVHRINGFGKYAGFEQIRETGSIETPIALTSTLNMARVADALITLALEASPYIGVGFEASGRQGYASVNPVVGECTDGFLSDVHARRIGEADVRRAVADADTGPVAEGSLGGGTGMSCFEWKGGIGTASRVVPRDKGGFTVGVLVQSNFGRAPELVISGVPVGKHILPPNHRDQSDYGSIMIVIATDAPLEARQLERLCKRASFGLARTGSTCHTGSGDVALAFSTGYRIPERPRSLLIARETLANEHWVLSAMGQAVIEAVEEAVYNSMFMSETMVGRDGNTRYGLPVDDVVELIRRYRPRGAEAGSAPS